MKQVFEAVYDLLVSIDGIAEPIIDIMEMIVALIWKI